MTSKEILTDIKSIVVLGLSDNMFRDSRGIALFLQEAGYTVCGVHPKANSFNNIPIYKKLSEVSHPVDLVDVFINGENLGAVVDEILQLGPKYVWFQLGVSNPVAAAKFRAAGITVVEDKCIAVEYRYTGL